MNYHCLSVSMQSYSGGGGLKIAIMKHCFSSHIGFQFQTWLDISTDFIAFVWKQIGLQLLNLYYTMG